MNGLNGDIISGFLTHADIDMDWGMDFSSHMRLPDEATQSYYYREGER